MARTAARTTIARGRGGQRRRPAEPPEHPDIPGLDPFGGPVAHSAQVADRPRLGGKRVAVIGTGASAFQLVPELSQKAAERIGLPALGAVDGPEPALPRTRERRQQVAPRARALLRSLVPLPALLAGLGRPLPSGPIDPAWPHQERAVNAANDEQREQLTAYMAEQIGDDPTLLAKVIPDFPVGGKRMLQDNGSWLAALKRGMWSWSPTRSPRSTRPASSTSRPPTRGRRHRSRDRLPRQPFPAADASRRPRRRRPARAWGDEPRAYLGITVPGFPNFFCLYGPGTNLAHAGSIIFHSECQVRYVLGCIRAVLEHGSARSTAAPDVYDDYCERFARRRADGLVPPG